MSQAREQYQEFSAGCKKGLLGAAMLLFLSGCEGQQDFPIPPKSPPRPVTFAPACGSYTNLVAWSLRNRTKRGNIPDTCIMADERFAYSNPVMPVPRAASPQLHR